MRRSALIGVSVLLFLVLLAFLQATTPPYATLTGPIRTSGHEGELISGTDFSAKVANVITAKAISFERFGRTINLESSGIWVVASIEVDARRETMPVRAATLVGSSGRKYRQSRRADDAPNALYAKVAQPGLQTKGIVIFELPADETTEMTLLLSEQYDPQLKDQIEISLGNTGGAPRDTLELDKNDI